MRIDGQNLTITSGGDPVVMLRATLAPLAGVRVTAAAAWNLAGAGPGGGLVSGLGVGTLRLSSAGALTWQAALKAAAAQAEKAAERVVVAALEEAARLAAAHTPDQVREKWPNAQPLCELTGIDFAGLERAALEKFPEPQAAAAGAKAKPATKKSGKTAGKKAVAGGR